MVVGAVLGPSMAAWIVPGAALSFLSELGVAMMLLLVGLKLSLPNVHVYRAAVAPAPGLAEQVMQLGGVPVTAANGALSSMRNATTL